MKVANSASSAPTCTHNAHGVDVYGGLGVWGSGLQVETYTLTPEHLKPQARWLSFTVSRCECDSTPICFNKQAARCHLAMLAPLFCICTCLSPPAQNPPFLALPIWSHLAAPPPPTRHLPLKVATQPLDVVLPRVCKLRGTLKEAPSKPQAQDRPLLEARPCATNRRQRQQQQQQQRA